jgi:hypothetical protein
LHPRCTAMHNVTCRSNQMQKLKFDVMCLDALFKETVSGPPKQET